MYKEDDDCQYVFIVKEGEFELTKRKQPEKKTSYKFDKLIGPQKSVNSMRDELERNVVESVSKVGSINSKMDLGALEKRKTNEAIRLGTFSVGSIFGEDDVLYERNRIGSVHCKTNKGVLYCLKVAVFYSKFKQNDDYS